MKPALINLPLDVWLYHRKGQKSHGQNRIFLHMGKLPFPYKFYIVGFYKVMEPNALLVDAHPTHGRNCTEKICIVLESLSRKPRKFSLTREPYGQNPKAWKVKHNSVLYLL